MRYTDWCRIRVTDTSDPEAAAALVPQARALLGQMMGGLQLGKLPTGTLRRELTDGSTITVSYDGVTPTITIDVPPAEEGEQDLAPPNVWLPRGFVVYPAWHDQPFGVGLPVVQVPDTTPWDKQNLAPGLDSSRWTAGGPCGELLLTPDKNAGYLPSAAYITVPLLYHPKLGPTLHWNGDGMLDGQKPTGAWAAYRLEHEAPFAHYGDEDAASMRALFDAVNLVRSDAGADALQLPIRGYYHAGQVMTSIMQAAGSIDATATGYPATYKRPTDRLSKDGYNALRFGQTFTSWTRDDNLMGAELRALGGVGSAVEGWQADTTAGPQLVADYGNGATLDAGVRGGYLCASIASRDRWLQAGNQSWTPGNTDLPILSWMGFASVNLAWETFPATFNAGSTTQPIVPAGGFTNARGEVWLNYARSTDQKPGSLDPALSRHVFCRGRAIAQAPRGGLVWGACLATVAMVDGPSVDRLIALVHHPEDQGSAVAGTCRYLRVWWADMPMRDHLRADPQSTIVGEDAGDPWGWRGGQLIDLGVLSAPSDGFQASAGVNSLKYASQWRFSPDGLKAICLRDYGAQADYALNTPYIQTIHPRAVQLTFDCTPTSVDTSMQAMGYAGGQNDTPVPLTDGKAPLSGDTLTVAGGSPAPLYDLGTFPQAVDFDESGAIIYAYDVTLLSSNVTQDIGFSAHLAYTYLGIGPASAKRLADLHFAVLTGTSFKTPTQDFQPVLPSVIDVRRAVFLGFGLPPRFEVDITALTSMNGPEGGFSGEVAPSTPTDAGCSLFTTDLVNGVRMYRQGVQLEETWYPNPDGCIWWPVARCSKSGDGTQVFLPPSISASVQGFYGERFGQYIASYQVSPQPGSVIVAGSSPSDATCGCQLTQAALAGGISLHWMAAAEINPRGGSAHSSLELPASDWLIFAKVI